MQWHSSSTLPPRPAVYPVQVPVPAMRPDGVEPIGIEQHWARWTGQYWTCWALTPEKARMLEIPGPSAGYLWGL